MWFLAPILSALGSAGLGGAAAGAGAAGAAGAGAGAAGAGGALAGLGKVLAGNQLPQMAGKVAGGIFGDAASGAFNGMNNADMVGKLYQHQAMNPKQDKGGAQSVQALMDKSLQAGQSQAGQYQDMSNPQSLMQMMKSMFGGMM